MSDIRLVVGLGNPGSQYTETRHNVGFKVVEAVARLLGIDTGKKKFGAFFGQDFYDDKKLILLMPQEYMNRSGQAVATAIGFYKLPLEDVLVVTDDMALDPGVIRLRPKGSAGGHNGLADIIARLGTDSFARLRVGIGSSGPIPGRDYVLGRPDRHERELLDEGIIKAREAALRWIEAGIEKTMNEFNVRRAADADEG